MMFYKLFSDCCWNNFVNKLLCVFPSLFSSEEIFEWNIFYVDSTINKSQDTDVEIVENELLSCKKKKDEMCKNKQTILHNQGGEKENLFELGFKRREIKVWKDKQRKVAEHLEKWLFILRRDEWRPANIK